MNNIQEGLLAGKGKKGAKEYKKKFDECEMKVKSLRNKNNQLQKQCDNQLEGDIRLAIREQSEYIENEIQTIKKMITVLSNEFKDPGSKNKIKDLWNLAGKEIERNKRIMEQFVNRASSSASFLKRQNTSYNRKTKTQMQRNSLPKQKQETSLLQSEELDIDLTMQHNIMREKAALLKQIEEKNSKINQIMNDMGQMVGGQQHDQVNQIETNMINARDNLYQANDQLDSAKREQQKAKKKYIFIVILLIIVILIAGGMIYLFVA